MNGNPPVLSVSQINEYIKGYIDNSSFLSKVCIKGELSNFKAHYTGHFYFSLKDEKSVIKGVMFSSYASKVKFVPEDSMQVLITGKISVYQASGVYQVYAESLEPLGKGALYAAFEQMKQRLEDKGYFDKAHKKIIPSFPKKVGIITSPIGAAVADMKNIISRRYPLAEICIFPALVQGEGAVNDLCAGIDYFDSDKSCDVIILGRGGGSIEDLWAFNNEFLAEKIYHCTTPIISAVGHETDFTISDFVADLRAPTPSAAAELCVPDKAELEKHIISLALRTQTSLSSVISSKKSALENLQSKKCFKSPLYITERLNEEIANLDRRISKSAKVFLESSNTKLKSVSLRLSALNPMNVLARGYSVVFDKNNKVVTKAQDLKKDDEISLVMSDGKIKAKVQ